MIQTPHKNKLLEALSNPKLPEEDKPLLNEALVEYNKWIADTKALTTTGDQLVKDMLEKLNKYKDFLEVDVIAARGSAFLKRQKGQLKLDNSIMEEFLPYLIDPRIINNLPTEYTLEAGSMTSFMSLSFTPKDIKDLKIPRVTIKDKDQDFALGRSVYYQFSTDKDFDSTKTVKGETFLSVLAVECKVNFDKSMFQECCGTAGRLKQGCPMSKYFTMVEYLDMTPEDTRLTSVDNVFLIRKAHRLPPNKRDKLEEIRKIHQDFPICFDSIKKYLDAVQEFIDSTWYDPDGALERGSFV